MPDAPAKYSNFIWRREMGVDWRTAMQTPIGVIKADLEMMSLENKWGPQSLSRETDNATSEQPGIIRHVVGR